MNIIFKSGDYVSVPMTENLFWSRVGWLRNAMLTAEDFEFRLLYFHKLQELMRFVPWVALKTKSYLKIFMKNI